MVLSRGAVAHGTCDGKELCVLTQKVPKTLKGVITKPGGIVDPNKTNRDQLVQIIDKLMKRQKYIHTIFGVLYSADFPMGDDDEFMQDAQWPPDGCKMLRRVPKGWAAQWLLTQYSKDGLTKDHISGLEQDDPSNIMFLMGVALQLPLGVALPKELEQNGDLASAIFAARASSVGHRVPYLVQQHAITGSGFDFEKGNMFTLTWEEPPLDTEDVAFEDLRALKVKHNVSKSEVDLPNHVCVTGAFAMKDGWLDNMAIVELQPSSFSLWQFFDKGDNKPAFVSAIVTDKTAKKVLEVVVKGYLNQEPRRDQQAAAAAAAASTSSTPVPTAPARAATNDGVAALVAAKQLAAKARAEHARKSVKEKADARNGKRVIKLKR